MKKQEEGKKKKNPVGDPFGMSCHPVEISSQEKDLVRSKLVASKVDPKWILPFYTGWRREVVLRNSFFTDSKYRRWSDIYYLTPTGIRKRTVGEIESFLASFEPKTTTLTTANFTFKRLVIYREPEECIRRVKHCVRRQISQSSSTPKEGSLGVEPLLKVQFKRDTLDSERKKPKVRKSLDVSENFGSIRRKRAANSSLERDFIDGSSRKRSKTSGETRQASTVEASKSSSHATPSIDKRHSLPGRQTFTSILSRPATPPSATETANTNKRIRSRLSLDCATVKREPNFSDKVSSASDEDSTSSSIIATCVVKSKTIDTKDFEKATSPEHISCDVPKLPGNSTVSPTVSGISSSSHLHLSKLGSLKQSVADAYRYRAGVFANISNRSHSAIESLKTVVVNPSTSPSSTDFVISDFFHPVESLSSLVTKSHERPINVDCPALLSIVPTTVTVSTAVVSSTSCTPSSIVVASAVCSSNKPVAVLPTGNSISTPIIHAPRHVSAPKVFHNHQPAVQDSLSIVAPVVSSFSSSEVFKSGVINIQGYQLPSPSGRRHHASFSIPLQFSRDGIITIPNHIVEKYDQSLPVILKVAGKRLKLLANSFLPSSEGYRVVLPDRYIQCPLDSEPRPAVSRRRIAIATMSGDNQRLKRKQNEKESCVPNDRKKQLKSSIGDGIGLAKEVAKGDDIVGQSKANSSFSASKNTINSMVTRRRFLSNVHFLGEESHNIDTKSDRESDDESYSSSDSDLEDPCDEYTPGGHLPEVNCDLQLIAESDARKMTYREWMEKRKFHVLHAGLHCMLHVFEYLSVADVLSVGQVCKTWRLMTLQHCLWKPVCLRQCLVTDWSCAASYLNRTYIQRLDLRGMIFASGDNEARDGWQSFIDALNTLVTLRHIHFSECPWHVVLAVINILTSLNSLTVELVTGHSLQTKMNSARECPVLDISQLTRLKNVECIQLRFCKNIVLQKHLSAEQIRRFSSLKALHTLSLTSLAGVRDEQLSFIGKLTNLETLELGYCARWQPETYSELSLLVNLRLLCLEGGGNHQTDQSLASAIKCLTSLRELTLMRYDIGACVISVLPTLQQLKILSIWPQHPLVPDLNKASDINSSILTAVSSMPFLDRLDWWIMIDGACFASTTESELDPNSIIKIPLCDNKILLTSDEEQDRNSMNKDRIRLVSIKEIRHRLELVLLDTDIHLFASPFEWVQPHDDII